MRADIDRFRRSATPRSVAALLLLAGLLVGSGATADSVPVFFTGLDGIGISEADAMGLKLLFGDDIVIEPSFVGEGTGVLEVVSQDVNAGSVSPFPPLSGESNTASSTWQARNVSEFDLLGDTYLLFVTSDPFATGDEVVQYEDVNVGLDFDPDDGWVLVRAGGGDEIYYLPAVALGSLSPGQLTGSITVGYHVNEPLEQLPNGQYVLPQLRTGMGFTPIPEPGTAALLACGLALMAARSRRREPRAAARSSRPGVGSLAVALAVAFVAVDARSADEASVVRLRVEQLGSQGRCDEAITAARSARSQGVSDARIAFVEGQCAIRLRRYQEAIEPLEEARRLDPSLGEATLYLGMAHYHTGNLAAAAPELEAAEALFPDRAEPHLYRGLVMLERADAKEAAVELERAAVLDRAADPVASYYAGRAWQAAAERDRAEHALRRVVDVAPGTSWAEQAELALAGSDSRYRRRAYWGRVVAGMEFDSNVVLRGAGTVLPTEISDEKDWRGVWFLDGGTELFRNADWAVGTRLGYYGNAQFDLTDFDIQYPTVAVWLDRALGENTYLRLRPDFGYSWVGYDPFMLLNGATLSATHTWESAGLSRPFFRWERRDYHFNNGNPVLDRDGNEFIGAYDHELLLEKSETFLRGGFGLNYYDSDGTEYEYLGVAVRLLGRQALPWEVVFDLRFTYMHQRYENVSLYSPVGDPTKRRDDVFFVAASLERPIWDRLKLQLRYRYENDLSNVAVYDYDRHVAGAYFVFDFGSI